MTVLNAQNLRGLLGKADYLVIILAEMTERHWGKSCGSFEEERGCFRLAIQVYVGRIEV